METALSIGLGLGLSAACGFRVFVPFLVLGVAAATGQITLAPGFDWLASIPALIVLSIATLTEIVAYYVPWLDNLLDTVASPTAVVAGAVAMASLMTDADPVFQWTVAVIAGGGVAGLSQMATVTLRTASTAMSAGLGNPLVASLELAGALGLSLLAIALPIVALFGVALLLTVLAVFLIRRRVTRVTVGAADG